MHEYDCDLQIQMLLNLQHIFICHYEVLVVLREQRIDKIDTLVYDEQTETKMRENIGYCLYKSILATLQSII